MAQTPACSKSVLGDKTLDTKALLFISSTLEHLQPEKKVRLNSVTSLFLTKVDYVKVGAYHFSFNFERIDSDLTACSRVMIIVGLLSLCSMFHSGITQKS